MGSTSSPLRASARTALITASVAAVSLAAATPAIAGGHDRGRFTVSGIVVGVHGGKVRVLAQSARLDRHSAANRVLTLHMHADTHRHGVRTLAAGDAVTASGEENGATLDVTTVTAAPRPARALIGSVAGVSGNLVTLTSRDQVGGDGTVHHVDFGDRPVVDVANATFSGVATSAAQLSAGQTIVVLGERSHHVMLAAKVYSFSAMPSLAVGDVTASDATAKTLSVDVGGNDGDRHGDGEDAQGDSPDASPTPQPSESPDASPTPQPSDSPDASASPSDAASSGQPAGTSVAVDASNADVVINGNDHQQSEAFPGVGDKVLVVGAPGASAGSITASLVFAFNGPDRGGVGHNDD